jgi:membrane protein
MTVIEHERPSTSFINPRNTGMHGLAILKDPRALFSVLKETYGDWSEDKASRLAAALAYYTAFSIAPLLLISIAVAGLVFDREAAQGQIFAQLNGLLGSDGASAIQTGIANSNKAGAGTLSAVIGLATLIWSASNLFGQLQEALNTIWEVQPDPHAGLVATVKRRFLSMTMVLGIAFVLLVSLVLSAGLSAVGGLLGNVLPGGNILWQVVNFVVSFAIVTGLFAAIYKVLPDVTVDWGDVWIGAAVTALLFTIGKMLIGLYLGYASVGSTFGAAGSLLVFLVWVYYSAQILFFGAEFTQVYARRYGSRIVPSEGAIALTDEVRAQQGIPRREHVERVAALASSDEPVVARSRSGAVDGRQTGQTNGRTKQADLTDHARSRNGAHNGAVVSADGEHGKMSVAPKSKQRTSPGSGGTTGAPDAVKKLMWAGVVSGTVAVGAMAARRASAEIWRGIFHEDPPSKGD